MGRPMGRPNNPIKEQPITQISNPRDTCNKPIDIPCVMCYYNNNGICKIKSVSVPKLKQSAIEWPKEMR